MAGTILVTGGAGYVGAHACKALRAAGYHPVVHDNLVYGHEQAVQWGALERGYAADQDRLNEVFASRGWRRRLEATRVFNLGVGPGVSVRGILDAIERVTGKAVPHQIAKWPAGDPPVLVAEPTRARGELGGVCRQSNIDAIIATAWAGHQRRALG
jgi:UDP-glucose 4-epimerase